MSDDTRPTSLAPLILATTAGALLGYGRAPLGTAGVLLRLAGLGLAAGVLARPAADEIRRTGASRRTMHLRTTLEVGRPVAEVFQFCKDFGNFPRVVTLLERVTDYADGRSHWVARAPGGDLLEWDAVVTKYVPNTVIAWRSVTASPVDSSGLIRFAPLPGGRTRLDVEFSYQPEETDLGAALHALIVPPGEARLLEALERGAEAMGDGAVAPEAAPMALDAPALEVPTPGAARAGESTRATA